MTSVIVFVGETVDYTGDQGYLHIPPKMCERGGP